jgi:hypothetical protein
MQTFLYALAFALFGYLCGSIPSAVWITRLVKGVDVRTVGSGHATTTNTYRQAGILPAAVVLILDLTKGQDEAVNIIDGYPNADVASVDVSYDGSKVLFSMKRDRDDTYHIYWASLEPVNGAYELHQPTFGKP